MRSVQAAVLALLAAAGAASPAAAEDCFVWVKPGEAARATPAGHRAPAAARPHHLHHVRHIVGKPHPKPRQLIAAAEGEGPRHGEAPLVERGIAHRVSCDARPALQSKAPHPQRLLDALVSPAPPPLAAAPAPIAGPLDHAVFPGGPGATPPLTGESIGGWSLPVEPPEITPIVIAGGPPGGQPPVSPAPEPATWAMLFFGFAGVGSALRARRRRLDMVKSQ